MNPDAQPVKDTNPAAAPAIDEPSTITLAMMREFLSVPLLCDALDSVGFTRQSPRLPILPITVPEMMLVGRGKTTL